MRVRDRDRQRVGGVGGFRLGLRQQDLEHHRDLVLVGMTGADHGLLDLVGRVFGNRYAEHRRRQHGDAARLAEFQRRDAVLVDKGLFDRGLHRAEIAEHGGEPFMDREQPARQRQIVRRLHRAAADEDQPVALGLDHAPAGAAQAGVDADDPDGLANRGRCHGVVITPERSERNIKRTVIPCPDGVARLNVMPREGGDPVRRGSHAESRSLSAYWIARSSRATTAERWSRVRDTRSYPPIFAISASETSKLA